MRSRDLLAVASAITLLVALVPTGSESVVGEDPTSAQGSPFAPGELIVKMRAPSPGAAGRLAAQQRLDALASRLRAKRVRHLAGVHLSDRARARLERRIDATTARTTPAARSAAADRALKKVEERLEGLSRVVVLELPKQADVLGLAAQLAADPDVEYAQPNYAIEPLFTPNDPFFSSSGSWMQPEDDLWNLKLLEMQAAWGNDPGDFEEAGEGVVVAVVDSGLDRSHPDIAANVWVNAGEVLNGADDDHNGYIDDLNGFDFTRSVDANGDGDFDDPQDEIFYDPVDTLGHGTHVAGIIGATGNNAEGIVGVAPKAQIMAVRGIGPSGSGAIDSLSQGLIYAALNGADVINNSWGCAYGCGYNPVIEEAVLLAHDLDVVVVFAAGNASDDVVARSPQNMSETITVSATTPTDKLASFSSFGPLVDVGAPGSGDTTVSYILSLESSVNGYSNGLTVAPGYLRLGGTSMASPHVAGVAALLRGADPTLTNEQIRQILRITSNEITTSSPFPGYGRVNAKQALASTLDVEVLIETPRPRYLTPGMVELHGIVRGSGIDENSVEISVGQGESPTSFVALPTSYDEVTGQVTAPLDASGLPGSIIARLRADDATRTYESSTLALVGFLDEDYDGAYENVSDNCPGRYNPDQLDSDGDGLGDLCDSCRLVDTGNEPVCDGDADGFGNHCDCDLDQNGTCDFGGDYAVFLTAFSNYSQGQPFDPSADLNCDGAVDFGADYAAFLEGFQAYASGQVGPGFEWLNSALVCPSVPDPSLPDTDGDGIVDPCDTCAGFDPGAAPACDADADGIGNHCDCDLDQDGDCDAFDGGIVDDAYAQFHMGQSFDPAADLDCDGAMSAWDLSLKAQGLGAYVAGQTGIPFRWLSSGLVCAGKTPCPAP